MELQQESSKFRALSATTSRNLSSSSSAFVSAIQSPFFSPRSPTSHGSESVRFDIPNSSNHFLVARDSLSSNTVTQNPESLPVVSTSSSSQNPTLRNKIPDQISSPNGICNSNLSNYIQGTSNSYSGHREKQKKWGRSHGKLSFVRGSSSLSSNRLRNCDVYIGLHGHKPSLLRFANWLCAELEVQGVSCFAADRARCRNARSHEMVVRAMNASTFGVVIVSKKSFGNAYSIEELKNFLGKKNLVPIFFDLGPGDCLTRDIIEKRGELWEKHGGELWTLYGGLEEEWKEAVNGLSRVDEWKLEAHDGNWRECILRTVVLLGTKLGRRSAAERVNRWMERVDKEEFPFPRNENFIGRKKELSELELILFGDVSGDGEREYFELKTKHKRKNLVIGRSENNWVNEKGKDQGTECSNKGKEPVIWKESLKEIEMQRLSSPQRQYRPLRAKNGGRYGRRKRSMKILYGKGIACVSGESGIGKTELLLEFAYRFSQRYKMVLWVGGETRYIRQNYLNLWSFLEVDVSAENQCTEKGKTKTFEEQEEEAIARVRKELMRDIPFLVVIDNLESEKDWWDQKIIMDLLPHFGGETHFIISTHLPRILNLEPLKLSYLSGVEAMSLMKGRFKDYPVVEMDALKVIEEKLGRLTLGLGIVGSILSELPLNPSRLLDTINRMPFRDWTWSGREGSTLRRHIFFVQLLEVCFSIFDHADGPWSLATRMVHVSGWFAPTSIPILLLAMAAQKIPDKQPKAQFWKKCLHAITCGFRTSHIKRSETEASAMLVRFGIARSSTKQECIHFHEIIKVYARKRGVTGFARAMVQSISIRGSISQHHEHLWAACFLLFGFGTDHVVVELKAQDLLFFAKRVVLPLAIHTFITFSRCNAALELLRLCTDALESVEESLVSRVEKCLNRSVCWRRSVKSNAQLNPYLWQELALLRATVLETRAKLMLRGEEYNMGDGLIRKAIFIRSSICGEHHPETISARKTLSKLTRLLTNVQVS
ncbi:disease resistance protein (TIR-NBS class) [Tasmannia lanceolata]|uniref:disease resistance protein (TIR-NBS class) n=1 Tax=Tasmannia lanceolata TaxID=3420 RepID=UPI004063DB9A